MGSAVGQVPEYIEMVARWCKQHTRMPVFVKLTPNVTNILAPARAAKKGGADAVSLINTINSVMAVDLDTMAPEPIGARQGRARRLLRPGREAHRARAWWARSPRTRSASRLPISGIGGIETWRDAAEFIAHGRGLGPGLHRGHALRLQDRRGHGHGPRELDGREGLPHASTTSAARPSATTSTGASST